MSFSETMLPQAFHVVMLRIAPSCIYIAWKHRRAATRTFAVLNLAAVCWLAGPTTLAALPWLAVAYGYFAMLALALHALARRQPASKGLGLIPIFVLTANAGFVLPALLLRDVTAGTFLFIGWELMLKAYSYLAEPTSRNSSCRTTLFFFLVDPTLLFTQRGQRAPSTPRLQSAARIALGVAGLALSFGILDPIARAVGRAWGTGELASPWVCAELSGCLHFIATYAKHAGGASIHVGLLALSGYAIQERYLWPLGARSPLQFWSRWNTYVGQWARKYIYFPLSLGFCTPASAIDGRRRRSAALATFASIKVLHDLYVWVAVARFDASATWFFLTNGLFALIWLVVERGLTRTTPLPLVQAIRSKSRWIPQLVFLAIFFVISSLWAADPASPDVLR